MPSKYLLVFSCACLVIAWHLSTGGDVWWLWPNSDLESYVFKEIRMPRLFLAILNGGALGLAGAILQLLLRNPLAEPGITGIAGGAAVATVAALYVGGLGPVSGLLPFIGLTGGLMTLALLWSFARREPKGSRIILAGVALAAMAGAFIAVILNLAPNPFAFQEWAMWLMGSVANRGWPYVMLMVPAFIVSLLLIYTQRFYLKAQVFDEETVQTLGFNEKQSKFILLLVVALLASASVVTAGVIGFVGLLAPHLARLLGLVKPIPLIITSGAIGSILLTAVDAMVKSIDTRVELQLGVVIALLGGPWLLFLLVRQEKHHASH